MYTETVLYVMRKLTFLDLEALACNDERLEALWNFADNGFKALLMEELINDTHNDQGIIPDLDSIYENFDKNYLVYMTKCYIRACLTNHWGYDENGAKTILAIVPMTFNAIRSELTQLPDKTALENVRLVRKHSTKERLMKLISDRIEPDSIPTIETIANIINSVTDKYLDVNSIWS